MFLQTITVRFLSRPDRFREDKPYLKETGRKLINCACFLQEKLFLQLDKKLLTRYNGIMNRGIKGALLALAGGACWGFSGCTGQYLFSRQGMPVYWLVPIRLGVAGILIVSYYLIVNPHIVFSIWRSKRSALLLLVYGILGVSMSQFTYFLTIDLSTAGAATILQDVSPAIILAVTCMHQKRRPKLLETAAVILAIVGVFLLTTHGDVRNMAISPAAVITGLACAVFVVVYTMTAGFLQKDFPTPLMQGWAFLLGGVFFSIIFRPWSIPYTPNGAGFAGIAVVVLVGNILAFNLYMTGVKYIGPERSSLFSFSEPVTAALISSLVLGSPFTLWDAAGFACIFLMIIGLFVSSLKEK
jgi:drug/metabolite transporter (DMT)-like permease